MSIEVGVTDPGSTKARQYGGVNHTQAAVSAMLKKLSPDGEVMELCYVTPTVIGFLAAPFFAQDRR